MSFECPSSLPLTLLKAAIASSNKFFASGERSDGISRLGDRFFSFAMPEEGMTQRIAEARTKNPLRMLPPSNRYLFTLREPTKSTKLGFHFSMVALGPHALKKRS